MEVPTLTTRRPRRAQRDRCRALPHHVLRLDELGLEAVWQYLDADRAVVECRVFDDDGRCREHGAEGVPRDTVARRLAHEPFGCRPTIL